ncbi:MAG TPA: nucleoside deaminase [Edaphocola sp.]|nr:nucleoside deaminase [Edaphocola sp.]
MSYNPQPLDIEFLKEAIALSRQFTPENGCGPFGCVIVKEGQVIGKGRNTVLHDQNPTAHAEINAIADACKALNDYQLHNCVAYCSAEPCPMCLGALYWARVKAVYFANTRKDTAGAGFDDAFIYEELNVQNEIRRIPFYHIALDEAKTSFEKWRMQGTRY